MARVICIVNQKGGVGKTTTAINLATSLALREQKTLLLDTDPQGNASSGVGLSKDKIKGNLYHAILDGVKIDEIMYPTMQKGLQVIPSHIDLFGAEVELVNLPNRESRLRSLIEPIRSDFDYILIDCPPSLGFLTLNALTAADSVLIPVQCEYYALEGLAHLFETLRRVKKALNPGLVMEGILLTMFDVRNKLSHLIVQDIRTHFNERVFTVIIPRNVRLSEAPSFGKPAYFYDKNSRGAQCYLELAREIVKKRRNPHE